MAAVNGVNVVTATSVALTVDTITLSAAGASAEVTNHSSTQILWLTADGSTPTVAGGECWPVLPLTTRTIRMSSVAAATTPVKLISTLAALYTVARPAV